MYKRYTVFLFLFVLLFLPFLLVGQDYYMVDNIIIEGNQKTKDDIILRELRFGIGDTISSQDWRELKEKSIYNLEKTSLFNFIEIQMSTNGELCTIKLLLEERWYLWPYPIFEHADRNLSSFLYSADWSRINYGLFLVKYNFRGRNDVVKLKFRSGFRQQYGMVYENTNLDKEKKLSLYSELYYFRQRKLIVNQEDFKPVYLDGEKNIMLDELRGEFGVRYRPSYDVFHTIKMKYDQLVIADTVNHYNKKYASGDQGDKSISFSYRFLYNSRNSNIFPLKGVFTALTFKQYFYGENFNSYITELASDLRAYYSLGSGVYVAGQLAARYRQGKEIPFHMNQALGYEVFTRGYENYIFNAKDYVLARTSLKYELIGKHVRTIPLLPRKFSKIHYALYLEYFAEAFHLSESYEEYEKQNQLGDILGSTGLGLSLVTYYDWVVRGEFSANSLLDYGVFISLHAPF
ncbi:MAG: hypothetical protein C0594_04320 [Marinilabiliales bacterium]|nr:MAG: hypothetical protein C0594_04320 [Marinilabiliales bacterium]